jgi:UDP:flavonoid glycosyltransferase YjiC (YdhE family)
VTPRRVNAKRLRSAVRAVLENDSYRRNARRIQSAIAQVDGLDRAADIIEDVLKIATGVRSQMPSNRF